MKKDIKSKEDIVILVDTFYNNVRQNNVIGPIFTDIVKIDWAHHLPKMYAFWESILFGKATYKGNPMLVHFDVNKKIPIAAHEFDTWKNIFFQTVDELFEGENSTLVKQKAQSIADLMNFKINVAKSTIRIV